MTITREQAAGEVSRWAGKVDFRMDILVFGFLPWPEFNRRCWKLYGTGRTEPDE